MVQQRGGRSSTKLSFRVLFSLSPWMQPIAFRVDSTQPNRVAHS